MDNDERVEILKRHVAMLNEHFQCVQIFATRGTDDDTCTSFEYGSGSWYERYGVSKAWVIRAEEAERDRQRQSDCED